jgi:hypothetical protein
MNNIYNIKINESNGLIDYFEWDDYDTIKNIKKCNIIKISKKTFIDIYSNEVIINNPIGNIVITDSFNTLYLETSKGKIAKRSSISFEDELEIIENSYHKSKDNIDYQIIKKINYTTNYRKTTELNTALKKEIKKLKERDNLAEISYIYYECFNKKSNNYIDALNSLNTLIEKEDINAYKNLKEIFNLINYSANSN